MRINAINAHEASKQILRIIFITDYNQSNYKSNQHSYTYVYFSPQKAYYSFESQQRKMTDGLIKRYKILDIEDIINITAYKYSFIQIVIGAILSRKIMTHREFFEITKNHFDWV